MGIVSETDAVAAVMAAAEPGDLVLITATDVAGTWRQVTDFCPMRGRRLSTPAPSPSRLHLAAGH